MSKRRNIIVLILILTALFFLFFYPSCSGAAYRTDSGRIFGTFYNIKYQHPGGEDLHQAILATLNEVDASLSMFNDTSVISRINANTCMRADGHFSAVFLKALEVSARTGGAFDITVAPLVNAWGFGKGTDTEPTPQIIDSLRALVGYGKVSLDGNLVSKLHPDVQIDASAIAKGYGCDAVARMLRSEGCANYLVEIGGEIACAGVNSRGEKWAVGINRPDDDPASTHADIEQVIRLSGAGLATSGNYRQFYVRDGQRRAHTIDPRTGYPVQHDVLSATVVAPTCMEADAYATAFMVLGADSALRIAASTPGIECLLICTQAADGQYTIRHSDGFEDYMK